ARKAGLAPESLELAHVGFGTMNGKDGKPFKTRAGGVMRLETLLNEVNEEMIGKIRENKNVREQDAEATAEIVSLAAIKYGDLWNQASKDYVFDIEKFASFEGNTGPYILYTIVRISSILRKGGFSIVGNGDGTDAAGEISSILRKDGSSTEEQGILCTFKEPETEAEKNLVLSLLRFGETVEKAAEELAPHKICAYVYALANDFNRFYHETKILSEPDEEKRAGYLSLLVLTVAVLTKAIDLLGFSAPERM
ncbi:MAG: arginine--tRNA ligase domain-containing protein, partial [Lachnospiraceae bacterium]